MIYGDGYKKWPSTPFRKSVTCPTCQGQGTIDAPVGDTLVQHDNGYCKSGYCKGVACVCSCHREMCRNSA